MKEIEVPEWEKFKDVMMELQSMWLELHGDLEFLHETPKGMRSTQIATLVLYLMKKDVI